MKSETRAKLASWIRSPKSIAAKAGIGIAAITIVSVGTVSAIKVVSPQSDTKASGSDLPVAKDRPKVVVQKNSDREALDADTSQPDSSTSQLASRAEQSVANTAPSTQPVADPPTVAEPEQPATASYVNTYPAELRAAPRYNKIDQWGMTARESVSYTAFKVFEAGKNMPHWGMGSPNGDARNWPVHADQSGIPRGVTPKVGSVGVAGNFTVWVEAVDGNMIDVSFYNWNDNGEYGYWNGIPASQFATYIYF